MRSFLILLLSLSFYSCSKKVKPPKAELEKQVIAQESYTVSVPFKIKVVETSTQAEEVSAKDDAELSEQQKLVKQIVDRGSVDFDLITSAFIEYNLNDFKGKIEEREDITEDIVNGYFDEILAIAGNFNSETAPSVLKQDYMKLLAKESSIKYNRDFTNFFQLFSDRKFQCYSATSFFQLISHMVYKKEEHREKNFVVIYEEGHVLPGQLSQNEEGLWELTGFEATVMGRGIKRYGLVKNIKNTLVIEANHFMILQAIKDVVSNPLEIRTAIISYMEEKYGFHFDLLELMQSSTIDVLNLGKSYKKHDDINSDMISFGTPKTPAGDQEVEEVEEFKIEGEGSQTFGVATPKEEDDKEDGEITGSVQDVMQAEHESSYNETVDEALKQSVFNIINSVSCTVRMPLTPEEITPEEENNHHFMGILNNHDWGFSPGLNMSSKEGTIVFSHNDLNNYKIGFPVAVENIKDVAIGMTKEGDITILNLKGGTQWSVIHRVCYGSKLHRGLREGRELKINSQIGIRNGGCAFGSLSNNWLYLEKKTVQETELDKQSAEQKNPDLLDMRDEMRMVKLKLYGLTDIKMRRIQMKHRKKDGHAVSYCQ